MNRWHRLVVAGLGAFALALACLAGFLILAFKPHTVATWVADDEGIVVNAVCVPDMLGADLQLRVRRGRREVARLTLVASLDTRADCRGIGGAPGVEIRGIDTSSKVLEVSFSRRIYRLPLILGGPETYRRQVSEAGE